jgi:hypothetical protein
MKDGCAESIIDFAIARRLLGEDGGVLHLGAEAEPATRTSSLFKAFVSGDIRGHYFKSAMEGWRLDSFTPVRSQSERTVQRCWHWAVEAGESFT